MPIKTSLVCQKVDFDFTCVSEYKTCALSCATYQTLWRLLECSKIVSTLKPTLRAKKTQNLKKISNHRNKKNFFMSVLRIESKTSHVVS